MPSSLVTGDESVQVYSSFLALRYLAVLVGSSGEIFDRFIAFGRTSPKLSGANPRLLFPS